MTDPKNLAASNPIQAPRAGAGRTRATALMTETDLALHKPDWQYGLDLMPAHLQHQTRYYERLVDTAVRSAFDLSWGVTDVELNTEALGAGQVVIDRLHAIFPDGTPIVIGGPNANARIAPRSFEPELRSRGTVDVYVGLLHESSNDANVQAGGADASRARFAAVRSPMRDFNTGQDPVDVEWLCADLRLLSDVEPRDQYSLIRVAKLERSKTGTIELSPEFAPPALRIHASTVLTQSVAAVKAALQTARAALVSQHGGDRDASIPDAVRGFVLSTIGQLLPELSRVLSSPSADPSEAFHAMAETVGALSAYAPAGTATIPSYNHTDPGPGFVALAAEARRILYWVGAPPYRQLPIARQEGGIWTAALSEPALFAREFLVVVTGGDPNQLRQEITQLARVASVDEIGRVIQAAMPGVRLLAEVRRVQGLPLPANSAGFRFDKNSPMWRSIVSKGTLALQLPPSIAATADVALFVEASSGS